MGELDGRGKWLLHIWRIINMTNEVYIKANDLHSEINYIERLCWLIQNASKNGNVLVAYNLRDGTHINEEALEEKVGEEIYKMLKKRQLELEQEFAEL